MRVILLILGFEGLLNGYLLEVKPIRSGNLEVILGLESKYLVQC